MKLQILPARQGVLWVKLGIQTFFRQPLALSGLFFMFVIAVLTMGLVPLLGNVLTLAALPGATLGLMAATQEAASGKFPMPANLLRAFRVSTQQTQFILMVGMWYVVCFGLLLGLSALIDGGKFGKFILFGGETSEILKLFQETDFQVAFLFTTGLNIPIALVFFHAAAMVHWYRVAPTKSIFFSVIAFVRNFRAFVIFGLTWFGVCIALLFVVSLFALVGVADELLAAPLAAGAMLLDAMIATSIYFTFRDSFEVPSGETP